MLVVASVTLRELVDAPENVRRVLASLPAEHVESIPDCSGIVYSPKEVIEP